MCSLFRRSSKPSTQQTSEPGNGNRRSFLKQAGMAGAAMWLGQPGALQAQPVSSVRLGLTPVFSDAKGQTRQLLTQYFEESMGISVAIYERQKYREILDMLLHNELDMAWLCGYPYVNNRDRLRLLAVPVYQGQPTYQSYLIGAADNDYAQDILDFESRLFAYSDPDSFSGHIFPKANLIRKGFDPETFFARTVFTYRHDWVVEAVAQGLVDAGNVDGYVWDTMALYQPELVAQTKVLCRSERFGFPPFVTSNRFSQAQAEFVRSGMISMHLHPTGKKLLKALNLDAMQMPLEGAYDQIETFSRFVNVNQARHDTLF